MKSQKDIETTIREGEKKLTIQPSGRAWQKLERRLESRPRRRTNGNIVAMRQWLAVAATLLVLVVSLFFISNGESDYDYRPTFVEELGDNKSCNPYCMNIEAKKMLPAFYAVPTKEALNEQS